MTLLTPQQAADALRTGGIVATPTEGVMGLSCDPFDQAAVGRLLALKGRPVEKGLILVAAGLDQLDGLIDWSALPGERRSRIEADWPGPVTWTLPATSKVPVWIRGRFPTVAVRISAHSVMQALCRAFDGPVVSTSANRSGQPPALGCDQAVGSFGEALAGCVEGALGGHAGPTPIYDGLTGAPLR